jgi:hypothetical protein
VKVACNLFPSHEDWFYFGTLAREVTISAVKDFTVNQDYGIRQSVLFDVLRQTREFLFAGEWIEVSVFVKFVSAFDGAHAARP